MKNSNTMTNAAARAYFANGGKGKAKAPKKKTEAQKEMERRLQEHRVKELQKATGLEVTTEHQFHPDRKWRFDFYIPDCKIGIECEGGIWKDGGGRHNRGEGYTDDMEKYSEAAILGYCVLRFTPQQMLSAKAKNMINRAIQQRLKPKPK